LTVIPVKAFKVDWTEMRGGMLDNSLGVDDTPVALDVFSHQPFVGKSCGRRSIALTHFEAFVASGINCHETLQVPRNSYITLHSPSPNARKRKLPRIATCNNFAAWLRSFSLHHHDKSQTIDLTSVNLSIAHHGPLPAPPGFQPYLAGH
jgi:hypothetical protein